MKIAILGPNIDHRASLEAAFQLDTKSFILDSHSYESSVSKIKTPLTKIVEQFSGTLNPRIDNIVQFLKFNNYDTLIVYWSTGPLNDIAAIKKKFPRLRIYLMALCYPLAFDKFRVIKQHLQIKMVERCLTGIIYPTTVMRDYFLKNVLSRNTSVESVILSPCWPGSFQVEQQFSISDKPSVAFIGRTDLSHKTVHIADDIRQQMGEIMDVGIELHHAFSEETSDGNPLRRCFRPMSQVKLMKHISRCDASLIMYNDRACQNSDRLMLTVPDRLITSVTAGVPIAIPSKGYDSCYEYLQEYGAVIKFDSFVHLQNLLADRDYVASLKRQALETRTSFKSDFRGDGLLKEN